jgi:hypothetical protein
MPGASVLVLVVVCAIAASGSAEMVNANINLLMPISCAVRLRKFFAPAKTCGRRAVAQMGIAER